MMNKPQAQSSFLRKVYSRIAPRYELANHILTLGLDIQWRRKAARLAVKVADENRRSRSAIPAGDPGNGDVAGGAACVGAELWLDACTGTGEMAQYLSGLMPEGVKVFGLDFSIEMLAEAVKRGEKPPAMARKLPARGEPGRVDGPGIAFSCADMDALPFPDNTFGLVTMAFAMRNNNPDRETLIHRLREIRRVLEPGGLFVNVETSQPDSSMIAKIRDLFVRAYVPLTGALLAGDREGYRYLAGSIEQFYGCDELGAVLEEAGFTKVEAGRLLLGIAAVHIYRK